MQLDGAPSKLLRHPDTPRGAIWRVCVWFERRAGGGLSLRYALYGDVAKLLIPTPTTPARTDELWKHTCFEAFIRPTVGEGYYELNFAPSGQWAAYQFDGYRAGMRPALDIENPKISTSISQEGERFDLIVDLQTPFKDSPWKMALTAVVEELDASMTYWAFGHAPGKPDFHASTFGFAFLPAGNS